MTAVATPRDEREREEHGPKFHVNIEGVEHEWDRDTITVPELRALGSLPENMAVEEIELNTNTQRTLAEAAVVSLRPGLGFAKKIKFQRG